MASKVVGASVFALNLTWRAIAIGALAFCDVYLIAETRLYATALVVAGIAALIATDLARVVSRADRTLERFLDSVTAGSSETPTLRLKGFARLSVAIEKTARGLSLSRAMSQRDIEYLQSLLDTVTAALLVVSADGRVTLVNRAARNLVHGPVSRIEEIAALDGQAVETLSALTPGARQIVRFADGRQALAAAAKFSIPGSAPQRLISVQRIAGELDAVEVKAWRDVARVLAHEMMNSLTPIASLSESLEALLRTADINGGAASQGDFAGAVEAIRRRSLGLMGFVERYRQIAELPTPDMRVIDLGPFLGGIARLMSATFAVRRIEFRSELSIDVKVLGDPQLLEHAIINLICNATEAVAEIEYPRIELSCEIASGEAVISVIDNGRGLPKDVEEIFVPFFTTKSEGSGIGLCLVRQIALAHGGRVEARNAPHRGAVFSLVLPTTHLT